VDIDPNQHYDFGALVGASVSTLLSVLAETHSAIANLTIRVGFLRQEEMRGADHAKTERAGFEALRDAYIEKKWLVKTLLEHHE
jgi:hypothetical protein